MPKKETSGAELKALFNRDDVAGDHPEMVTPDAIQRTLDAAGIKTFYCPVCHLQFTRTPLGVFLGHPMKMHQLERTEPCAHLQGVINA